MEHTPRERDNPSVWMYVSGLAVAYSGLLAARIVIEDVRFTTMLLLLVLGGFVFSFIARQLGWFNLSPGLFVRWLFAALDCVCPVQLLDAGMGHAFRCGDHLRRHRHRFSVLAGGVPFVHAGIG
jgi:hypothetical protein